MIEWGVPPSLGVTSGRLARSVLLAVVLALILFLLQTSGASAEEYVVRSGDTLARIAKRYEMTYQELARNNRIADPNRIRVGQKLTVPWEELQVQGIPEADYARVRQWDKITVSYARWHHIDPDLIRRVMWIESKGNQYARSRSGAMGLMQVMPLWFKAGEDPYSALTNISRGAAILRLGRELYGSWEKAVAWYFHGSLVRFGNKIPTTYTDLVFTR